MTDVLVVGVGRPDRGDDAVGPAVSGLVRELNLGQTRVVEVAEPVGLLEAWEGADTVVVADAVRSGRRPGTVHLLHAGHGPLPVATGAGGTHDLGLGQVVELARSLGRLPRDVVVVGVEGREFGLGEPLSPPVAAAVELAARTIAGVVRTAQT